jgi:hypothetical protein
MDERLAELQRRVGAARRRLEDQARRLATVRERLRERGEAGGAAREAALPLFGALGVGGLDDLELHFEALGTEDDETEDPTREEQ